MGVAVTQVSMFPLARVPFRYRFFEPQHSSLDLAGSAFGGPWGSNLAVFLLKPTLPFPQPFTTRPLSAPSKRNAGTEPRSRPTLPVSARCFGSTAKGRASFRNPSPEYHGLSAVNHVSCALPQCRRLNVFVSASPSIAWPNSQLYTVSAQSHSPLCTV